MLIRFIDKLYLALLLLTQGLYVRMSIVKLPEAVGIREGTTGSGPHLSILVLGDSAAAGVGVKNQDQALLGQLRDNLVHKYHLNWELFAKSGATTESTLIHLKEKIPKTYDYVIISLGVNDVISMISTKPWLGLQAELHSYLKTQFNAKKIIVSSLPPIAQFHALPNPLRKQLAKRATMFSSELKQYVRATEDIIWVNISDNINNLSIGKDGFHPSEDVYREWAILIAKLIDEDQN